MIGRTLSHVPTLASLNIRYKKTFGHKFRDAIATCGHHLKPVKKYVFPNFLAVHYFYIIFMTIITSILLYPVKNTRYIDILFLSAGCTTQGGLNTVNLNDLRLYQQIIFYIVCFFCTPIAIHGCLAFVRLYWFERYFDGIRDSSKRNFKMRRTKTIIEREMTSRTMTGRTMSRNPQRGPRTASSSQNHTGPKEDFQEKLFSGKMLFREEGEPNHVDEDNHEEQSVAVKDKSGLDSNGSSWSSSNTMKDNGNHTHPPTGSALTFSEPLHKKLKQPRENFAGRRRSADISPEDMYRSITMLKDQHQEENEDDGPPLVISAPIDRKVGNVKNKKNGNYRHASVFREEHIKEEDEAPEISKAPDATKVNNKHSEDILPESHSLEQESKEVQDHDHASTLTNSPEIHNDTQRSVGKKPEHYDICSRTAHGANIGNAGPLIQFDVSAQPKKRPSRPKYGGSSQKIPSQSKSMPKKALLKGLKKGRGLRQKFKRRISTNSFEKPPKDGANNDENNMEEYFADDDVSDDENNSQSSIGNNLPLNISKSFDQGTFPKFGSGLRKTGSLDIRSAKDLDQLAQSPDFQSMIYKNWKRKHKKQALLKRRKSWNSKFFDNEHSNDFPWNQVNADGGNDSSEEETNHDKLRKYVSHPGSHHHEESDYDTHDGQEESANSNSINGQDMGDEEQGYYGFEIDPAYEAVGNRPGLSRTMSTNYLSWQPTIGRNSTFMGLSRAQKEELGGVEYTSIKLLCRILLVYYFGFFIMAFVMLVPWISAEENYKKIVRADGISPIWWGFFTSMSAFTDLGFTLTPDSMNSFNKAIFPLIAMMWFIVIGNTGFPILLRFIIWIMFKLSPELSQRRENLGFLLDHPRRCFTLLFPSGATWWLLATLIFLNGTDLVLFIILDFGSEVLKPLSHGFRVLSGLFQAISTRTAGFTVVNLSQLHPSVQVSYMLMMYVSVLPLAISIRRTNVYEEQSLGLYGEIGAEGENNNETISSNSDNRSINASGHTGDGESVGSTTNDGESAETDTPKKPQRKLINESFIGAHLRKQLSFDLWFLFLGLFIICICEGGKIQDPLRPQFNVFAVLFEIVSAYGTVGLSLGYPNTDASFSGQFTTLSKLVIIGMLIRGRHRGLPYALDRAIILPSERLDNIDHIEDLKLKRGNGETSTNATDPVTAYFKKKSGSVRNTLRKLKRSVSEPEEHLLHSYAEHHHNQGYNLEQSDQIGDHPLQDSTFSRGTHNTHDEPSSLQDPSVDYNGDSYEDELEDEDELPMTTQAPVAFHQTLTT